MLLKQAQMRRQSTASYTLRLAFVHIPLMRFSFLSQYLHQHMPRPMWICCWCLAHHAMGDLVVPTRHSQVATMSTCRLFRPLLMLMVIFKNRRPPQMGTAPAAQQRLPISKTCRVYVRTEQSLRRPVLTLLQCCLTDGRQARRLKRLRHSSMAADAC